VRPWNGLERRWEGEREIHKRADRSSAFAFKDPVRTGAGNPMESHLGSMAALVMFAFSVMLGYGISLPVLPKFVAGFGFRGERC
jgi:hypothetical protein